MVWLVRCLEHPPDLMYPASYMSAHPDPVASVPRNALFLIHSQVSVPRMGLFLFAVIVVPSFEPFGVPV